MLVTCPQTGPLPSEDVREVGLFVQWEQNLQKPISPCCAKGKSSKPHKSDSVTTGHVYYKQTKSAWNTYFNLLTGILKNEREYMRQKLGGPQSGSLKRETKPPGFQHAAPLPEIFHPCV